MNDTERRVSDFFFGDDFWLDSPMSGSAHYVSGDRLPVVPMILVPDGHGDYREHEVRPRPKGRLGF